MGKSYNINIKEVKKVKRTGFTQSRLELEFSGSDLTIEILNTLRRGAMLYVPVYSLCPESIKIERNSSVYNNDYMTDRLEQIQIPNLKIAIEDLSDEYWYNIDYSDPNRPKHPKDVDILDLYINSHNTSSENMNVTTNDVKLYLNGEEIKKFDKDYPQLLIDLRPKEYFHCHGRMVLGVAKRKDTWAAVCPIAYDETDKGGYIFPVESLGQMDEYEILYKACSAVKARYRSVKDKIKEEYEEKAKDSKKLEITLAGEDHTVGLLINYHLQSNKDVSGAGLTKKDLLVNEVSITYQTERSNSLTPLYEAIDDSIDIIDSIQKQIKKLGGKNITV